jgi:proteasome lid subunit RPN8/RPN11
MIRWTPLPPDASPLPMRERLSGLGVLSAIAEIAALGHGNRVRVSSTCLDEVLAHARSASTEVGGLLLGRVFAWGRHPRSSRAFLIEVSDAVPSLEYDSSSVSLRMAAEVWDRAREAGGGRMVVGWYHSHPGLGAFFSGTDRRTQRAVFCHPYSIGLVVDPANEDTAWFIGGDSAALKGVAVHVVD